MIDPAAMTVRDLLPAEVTTMAQSLDETLRAKLPELRLPAVFDGSITGQVTQAITGVLDMTILSVLAGAWTKASEIRKYKTPGPAHPAAAATTLYLGEHDIEAALYPEVILRFAKIDAIKLRFTVACTAHVRAVQLTIREGHIVKVGNSKGSVKAQLKYGDLPLHEAMQTRDYMMTGAWTFRPPGIAIR